MHDIEYIRGSRAGGGRASIGPQLERDEHDKIYGPQRGKAWQGFNSFRKKSRPKLLIT